MGATPLASSARKAGVVDLPVAGVPEVADESDVDDESEQQRGENAQRRADDAQSGPGGRTAGRRGAAGCAADGSAVRGHGVGQGRCRHPILRDTEVA